MFSPSNARMLSVARPPAPINPIFSFSLGEMRRPRCEPTCVHPPRARPIEAVTELFRNALRLLRNFRLFIFKSINQRSVAGNSGFIVAFVVRALACRKLLLMLKAALQTTGWPNVSPSPQGRGLG